MLRSCKNLLVLRADIGDPEFVATLKRNGFVAEDLAIYRNSSVVGGEGGTKQNASAVRDADAIVFASPSAVRAFMKRFDPGGTKLTRRLALCIGPVTAAAAREHGFEAIRTSETHTIEGLLQCLESAAAAEGR